MRVIYMGGMILGNIEDHYAYERALAAFLQNRIQMFGRDSDTFWGKHRSDLASLEHIANFPDSAYHHYPEDPLVSIPAPDLRIMLLKRRYLNRLRQTFLKYQRRGRSIPYWGY